MTKPFEFGVQVGGDLNATDFRAVARCFTPDLRWDYGPGAGVVIETRDDLERFAAFVASRP